MELTSKGTRMGSAVLRIKYREIALVDGPSGIAGYIGTLKKGAVVEVLNSDDPYYYLVRLENGLEGYVYKAAGELTSGLAPTRMPREETPASEAPAAPAGKAISPAVPSTSQARPARSAGLRSANGSSNGRSYNGSAGSRPASRTGRVVSVTTSEIAVFDKPGITGRQIGKLRRGEQVSLLGQDSFFYKISLINGEEGYIPRYAAELA